MKWLTQKQVKEAAKKSRKAAIECSRLHWEQLATCTKGELLAKTRQLSEYHDLIGCDYCSLCIRYRGDNSSCDECPISDDQNCVKKSQWRKCYNTFRTSGFQVEAKKMEQLLGELT